MLRSNLRDESRSGGALVFPVGRKDRLGLVVSGQLVDTALDQDESVLGVLVLSVLLQVFPDGHGLLDQVVQVLWDLAGEALRPEDSEDLGAGQVADLVDAVRVPQDHSDLGGGEALLGQLVDHLLHLIARQLLPLKHTTQWSPL